MVLLHTTSALSLADKVEFALYNDVVQAVSLGMSIKAFTSVGYYNAELYDRVADYFVDRMDCLKLEV